MVNISESAIMHIANIRMKPFPVSKFCCTIVEYGYDVIYF